MKTEFFDSTMTNLNQYLPFILLCISTIILTVLAFILLPFILVYKKLASMYSKGANTGIQVFEKQVYNEHNNAYTYYIRGPEE